MLKSIVDNTHRVLFVVFMLVMILLYGWFMYKHFSNERDCTVFKGQCGQGQYCGVSGKCQDGKEGDSCFLGLAQCQRPFNCYPDFKCHKF